VSHEFRNPLTAIVCATEVLQAQVPPAAGEAGDETREYLGAIVRSADRMCRLMDELLLLGKIESGALRFQPLELSPVELCGSLRRELESAELQQRVVITAELGPDDLADLDPALLRHTLGNLLSNALKYSPPSAPVAVGIRFDGAEVCFTVTDRGIGIPEREQKRLFKAFFRASNVGAIKGTGVGLNIAYQCARLHGGSLEFSSVTGQGTTFTLRIPRHCAAGSRPQPSPAIVGL
jgi:signal transduction histidine kinase